MAPLLMHSSTLAIPSIATELNLDAEAISWFTLLNILGNACFVLPAGKLADIYGRRRVFCMGVLLAGVACLFSGLAESVGSLLIGRFVQGVGGAFIFGSSIALMSRIPPPEKKAQMMGVYIAICYLGIVAGPLFGGVVLTHFHWRWVFYLPAVILFLTAFVGFIFLHWEQYGNRRSRLRVLDTTLYMSALVLIAFAVFRTNDVFGQLLLLTGLVLFIGFCWFQTKRRDPLLQVKLFTSSSIYTTLGITHFLVYSSVLALPFTITLYLQYIKGISAQTAGFILISQALFTALVSPLGAWLSGYLRVRTLLFIGMILLCCASLMLAFVEAETSIWQVVLALILVGLGIGVMDTQLINASMAAVDHSMLGSASATMNGLRTIGGLVGIGVVSYFMGQTIGKQEITPDLYPALMEVLQGFFLVTVVFSFCALAALSIGVWFRSKRLRHTR